MSATNSTATQGNIGGRWFATAPWGGGWGWWNSSAGSNSQNTTTGWAWWNGTSNSISGTAVTYAGWGWGWWWVTGWAWWSWWWWAWWSNSNWTAWTANTWGGWGGWWANGVISTLKNWWNGWSWVVIIAYATDWSNGVSPSSTWWVKTTSGGQTIHTFTSSGTFTILESSTTNSNFLMFF